MKPSPRLAALLLAVALLAGLAAAAPWLAAATLGLDAALLLAYLFDVRGAAKRAKAVVRRAVPNFLMCGREAVRIRPTDSVLTVGWLRVNSSPREARGFPEPPGGKN